MEPKTTMHEHARGIEARCARGHTQRIGTPDMDVPRAVQLAGLIDGTSPLFGSPPRDHHVSGSPLARCGICGAWITCTLYGYDTLPEVPHA